MPYKKKLIEVALPLEAINAESAREKSIRHGHPSTLHLWWARRPLAAARAVIWASLVDDPSSLPEQFPTEEAQNAERERLFKILSELVKWENSNNQTILDAAKAEIMKSTNGNPPPLLDPFAGGGAIPLEAQRLGLEAHASDLNPVAVMINKAMIEIPPKFAGQPPINPEARRKPNYTGTWTGAQGLAEDVRYYGEWMKKKAFERIGHLYPKVKDEQGKEHTVIAWIWARTVKCPNPACGCEMPLASSFELSKKKGKEAYIQPVIEGKIIRYEVKYGKDAPEGSIINRRGARCVCCNNTTDFTFIREEARNSRMGNHMMAIVVEGKNGREYFTPSDEQVQLSNVKIPVNCPESELPYKALGINIKAYGFNQHKDLFTARQLTAITSYSEIVSEAQTEVEKSGGIHEYAQAIGVYLAFGVSRMTDSNNALCSWSNSRDQTRNLFARQAIPIVWDYAENNVFNNSAGDFEISLGSIIRAISGLATSGKGISKHHDAQTDNGLREVVVSTDPPYYDNIGYADLSDFFYIWLRQMLKKTYPDLFKTMLVPKVEELVANPFKFGGSREKACIFFETGMLNVFRLIYIYAKESVPVSVYYAFKQSDSDNENGRTSSTGWETMLFAIIQTGFIITGTWPISTEKTGRVRDNNSNALASSIVLVCRKRPADAPTTTRRDFINALKRELKPALQKLQASNIAPVDLAQSAIGPGMGVYSRFSKVLEADGKAMSVRSALQIINQELDLYFTEQDGELDRDSRFCVDLYTQNAFNDIKFGEADVLARAKNTSVEKLAGQGVLFAQRGVVRLQTRDKIPEKANQHNIWLLTQQLTRAMEKEGVVGTAKIISDMLTSEPEQAKALAYRLFTIAERRGWAQEAYAYNSLVIAWPDVQAKAAELQAQRSSVKQATLFD